MLHGDSPEPRSGSKSVFGEAGMYTDQEWIDGELVNVANFRKRSGNTLNDYNPLAHYGGIFEGPKPETSLNNTLPSGAEEGAK